MCVWVPAWVCAVVMRPSIVRHWKFVFHCVCKSSYSVKLGTCRRFHSETSHNTLHWIAVVVKTNPQVSAVEYHQNKMTTSCFPPSFPPKASSSTWSRSEFPAARVLCHWLPVKPLSRPVQNVLAFTHQQPLDSLDNFFPLALSSIHNLFVLLLN